MTDIQYEDRSRAPDQPGAVRQAASGAADAAGTAASDVAATAKEQAGAVKDEVKSQARNIAADVRGKLGTEVRGQHDRLADGLRKFVDELDEMVRDRGDSPASGLVTQVSQGGRRFADYLADRGPDGVLNEVQDFARRRPGAFLAVAAAAGFVVGRLGKGALNASTDTGSGTAASGYPAATYPAASSYPATSNGGAGYVEPTPSTGTVLGAGGYAETGHPDRTVGTTYASSATTGSALDAPVPVTGATAGGYSTGTGYAVDETIPSKDPGR